MIINNIYVRFFFFFKQKTAYEMSISDWSSDVCSSDLGIIGRAVRTQSRGRVPAMVAAAWTESQPLGLIRFWGLWFLKGAVRIRGEGGAFRRRARVRARNSTNATAKFSGERS